MSAHVGLEARAPEKGRAADCYAVARTAAMLALRFIATEDGGRSISAEESPDMARHASELHRISGALGALRVRQCNEDATCPTCEGSGEVRRFACVVGHRWLGAVEHGSAVNISGEKMPDCPECATGRAVEAAPVETCPKCKGTGLSIGPRQRKLEAAANEIAAHYGLRCYFQTDPRGCALYLIDPADVPTDRGPDLLAYRYASDREHPPTLARLQARWIEANYNRGHAVVRLGR